MRALLAAPIIALAIAGSYSETNAQAVIGSPMGALACYVRAEDQGLEEGKGVDLCLGAASEAPALCFMAALDVLDLADDFAVQLCRGATSNAPVGCAERLSDEVSTSEFVSFCAALPYTVVPVPAGGSARCFERGIDAATGLTDDEVIQLCRGSPDASPVACYQAGSDETGLEDGELVTLCAAVMVYAPAGQAPY